MTTTMTQHDATDRLKSKPVPGTGMRGGLGRTLLSAFLVLSIVPLSLISFVAATQARHNLQTELEDKLITIAALTESRIHSWVAGRQLVFAILSNSLATESDGENPALPSIDPTTSAYPTQALRSDEEDPGGPLLVSRLTDQSTLVAWFLADSEGRVLLAQPPDVESPVLIDILEPRQMFLGSESPLVQSLASGPGQRIPLLLKLVKPVPERDLYLVALFDAQDLAQPQGMPTSWSQSSSVFLVPPSGQIARLNLDSTELDTAGPNDDSDETAAQRSIAIEEALTGQSGVSSYENHLGVPVIGAYRWLSGLNVALLVEQAQDAALASSENLAVVLIGATLAMVLFTVLIATAIIRRITLPIVQLTATAVQIAAGDLDQKVPATRRDEIGILARAFNVMTTKLRVFYEDLEKTVSERTQQLREANAEIRYRAMQLAVSAEVGRVVTSILDRDLLLSRVVELIRDCFQAYFVAVYLIDESSEWAVYKEGSGDLGEQLKVEAHRVALDQDHVISQAVKSLAPQLRAGPALRHHVNGALFPHTRAELVVPLNVGGRVIGVLDVHSTHKDAFDGDETMVLETLSGQVAVAIENARVYEIERQTIERLRELEEWRRRFLANMSRELRMPLNNIIGFSRVIAKGIDGPITDLQREDLNTIHESGRQLLVLINDILDIAQIEAGAFELAISPVDLGEIAHSVIPTTNALLRGRPIRFHHDITPDLPAVLADAHRLRQVLVKLLSNAAKFTQEGEITLCVWRDNNHIKATVTDTGIGIPEKDRDRVFEMFRQGSCRDEQAQGGTGLGLTFSKEIIEMHGGTIRLQSQEGIGSAFTITLPIFEPTEDNQKSGE